MSNSSFWKIGWIPSEDEGKQPRQNRPHLLVGKHPSAEKSDKNENEREIC